MSAHSVGHFKAVLDPDHPLPLLLQSPTAWFRGLTDFICTQQQKDKILLMPTSEEITKLMFSLNPNKASGLNGLSSAFYKAAWSLIGTECVTSIQHFFNSGFLPKTTNSTILSLVPSSREPRASLITARSLVSIPSILQNLILPN